MVDVVRRGESPLGPGSGDGMRRGGPTVLRLMLGAQLRRLREARGISRQDAGYSIRASDAKISRLELGRVGYKQRDVADLLTLYGVEDEREREAFLTLAQQASSPGWWNKYSDVLPAWFEMYVGLEQAASVIRSYQVQFVPGLFQTADYARSVTLLGHPGAPPDDVDLRVDLRLARQEILTAGDAPRVWVVVDEAALRRPVGGASIMRSQLEHLVELTELPNVTLQAVPFQAGGHAAAGGPFSILRFSDPDVNDVAYLEQLTSALYLDKSVDVDNYLMVMDRLCAEAASPVETRKLLAKLIRSM
ncbi:helix-turn-helix transcriptional regulator [Pseudonocardia eucalypti]|uniref:Helix-turn-helix transcriptional regulator n=2 Tax=Pseudonocardia eucalypti TaxID=648755 RepID=A0ABP9QUA8_9PSEU